MEEKEITQRTHRHNWVISFQLALIGRGMPRFEGDRLELIQARHVFFFIIEKEPIRTLEGTEMNIITM